MSTGLLIQLAMVALIVVSAAAYLVRRAARAARDRDAACNCGCGTLRERR